MATWIDEYLTMITDCEKRQSRLTEWEQTFISGLREWLEREKSPSAKQIEILNRIWEKATAEGFVTR